MAVAYPKKNKFTMSETVIKLENISKQYRLGTVGTRTLRGDLQRWWHIVHGKEDPTLKIGQSNQLDQKKSDSDSLNEYVWALQNINLDVKRGEILGIIGKNGAGKSTLLKLLSRVTGPTTGEIKVQGRIASLLEVGTGFHPELTGRENIFLNGAILGMTKAEIRSKFDEIVDFAGVAKYIDTPVKRYSSGMYVRLAFAVAAHLEPDILVVDEVLAVGDAEFQKKAIGKMQDVSKGEGRTVLFVSHNMASVKALCSTGILMKNGMIQEKGLADDIVNMYLKGDNAVANLKKEADINIDNEKIKVLELSVSAEEKSHNDVIRISDKVIFSVKYLLKQNTDIHITIHLKDELGNVVFTTGCKPDNNIGAHKATVTFPDNFLNWGNFFIDLYIIENRKHALFIEKDIISFTIAAPEYEIGAWMGKEPGAIHPRFEWTKEIG